MEKLSAKPEGSNVTVFYVYVWDLNSEGRVHIYMEVFFVFQFQSYLLGRHKISDQFFRPRLLVLKRENIAILAVGESHHGYFL